MSAPATDRLRIPSPRPRPGTGRHQKPETPHVVVRTPAPPARQEPDQEPDTVVLAAADLRAAIPAPRESATRARDTRSPAVPTSTRPASATPASAGLRLPSWDPVPPTGPARVELRSHPASARR